MKQVVMAGQPVLVASYMVVSHEAGVSAQLTSSDGTLLGLTALEVSCSLCHMVSSSVNCRFGESCMNNDSLWGCHAISEAASFEVSRHLDVGAPILSMLVYINV